MNKPCRSCGRPSSKSICENCRSARERARPSRQERGYDAEYERAARAIAGGVRGAWARGETVVCIICLSPIIPAIPAMRTYGTIPAIPTSSMTVEHRVPLRHGGTNDASNLGPAHPRCNYGWRREAR